MPKPSLLMDITNIIQPIAGRVYAFPKSMIESKCYEGSENIEVFYVQCVRVKMSLNIVTEESSG